MTKETIKLLDEIIDSIDSPTNVPIGNYLSQMVWEFIFK